MSNERDEALRRIAGRDRQKARKLAAKQGFMMFASDRLTPLPIIDTSQVAMKKINPWIEILLGMKSKESK